MLWLDGRDRGSSSSLNRMNVPQVSTPSKPSTHSKPPSTPLHKRALKTLNTPFKSPLIRVNSGLRDAKKPRLSSSTDRTEQLRAEVAIYRLHLSQVRFDTSPDE